MACYKLIAVRFGKPAKGIEKDYEYLQPERCHFAEIMLTTGNRIGIYGTRGTVNVSISL